MHRVLAAGALLAGFILHLAPEAGTAQSERTWTERPDAYAPMEVTLDHLLAPGNLLLTYRLVHAEDAGSRIGQDTIPTALILQDFSAVPLEATRQRHVLEAAYGAFEDLTLQASVPFVRRTIHTASEAGFAEASRIGIGDVQAHALYSLHDAWPYRGHVSAGVSFPTGTIRSTGVTAFSHPDETLLPYSAQAGSGTFDFLPALTFVTENEHGTVGGQARGVVRLGENARGYRLGHRVEATGWLAYRFNEHTSGSARLSWERWGNVSGHDEALDPWAIPMANPLLQSGSRVDLPLGVNVRLPSGPLEGSLISAELLLPVHHDLDGPQLGRDWGLGAEVRVGLGDRPTPELETRRSTPAPRAAPRPTPSSEDDAEEPEETGTICLASGRAEPLFVTPNGETLVGSGGDPLEQVGREGGYAEGLEWFVEDEPLLFDEREYVKFSGEVALDCEGIVQVGRYGEVPFFVELGADEPYEQLYVPRRPGVWQAYELRPAVRG